jgi:hypothetical protein
MLTGAMELRKFHRDNLRRQSLARKKSEDLRGGGPQHQIAKNSLAVDSKPLSTNASPTLQISRNSGNRYIHLVKASASNQDQQFRDFTDPRIALNIGKNADFGNHFEDNQWAAYASTSWKKEQYAQQHDVIMSESESEKSPTPTPTPSNTHTHPIANPSSHQYGQLAGSEYFAVRREEMMGLRGRTAPKKMLMKKRPFAPVVSKNSMMIVDGISTTNAWTEPFGSVNVPVQQHQAQFANPPSQIQHHLQHQQQRIDGVGKIIRKDNATTIQRSFCEKRNERYANQDDGNATIFVSVASYRDPELPLTVADLFAKARFPKRIRVGVLQQNDPEDAGRCSLESAKTRLPNLLLPMDQIKLVSLNAREAKGPIYARHRIQTELYAGEDFFLQIDAHMIFVDNWDSCCLGQWDDLKDPAAVLSTYPNEYQFGHRLRIDSCGLPTFMVFGDFDRTSGMPFTVQRNCYNVPEKPIPSLFWSANFSFSRGELVKDVTYPPDLDYAFIGEEFLMAMRMYSRGWNLYHPSMPLTMHLSKRDHRPGTFWENFHVTKAVARGIPIDLIASRKATAKKSSEALRKRICSHSDESLVVKFIQGFLFGFNPDIPSVTGKLRSPKEFEIYCGVNVRTQQVNAHANKGLSVNPSSEEIYVKTGQIH